MGQYRMVIDTYYNKINGKLFLDFIRTHEVFEIQIIEQDVSDYDMICFREPHPNNAIANDDIKMIDYEQPIRKDKKQKNKSW